jgi:hypothetical protein
MKRKQMKNWDAVLARLAILEIVSASSLNMWETYKYTIKLKRATWISTSGISTTT